MRIIHCIFVLVLLTACSSKVKELRDQTPEESLTEFHKLIYIDKDVDNAIKLISSKSFESGHTMKDVKNKYNDLISILENHVYKYDGEVELVSVEILDNDGKTADLSVLQRTIIKDQQKDEKSNVSMIYENGVWRIILPNTFFN